MTDTASYSEWNPFMPRLSGELRQGARLEVRIAPPGGRPMTFKPTVLTVKADREVRWIGRFLLPRLFDGEDSLRLEKLDDNCTRFIQSERFTGILVPVFKRTLDKTEIGFEAMNAALKTKAEAR